MTFSGLRITEKKSVAASKTMRNAVKTDDWSFATDSV
jgi:hypothetical protein